MNHESAESVAMSWLDAFHRHAGDSPSNADRVLARALTGDAESVEALLREYHGPVYRICLRMMGNHEDAQDATQESLMRILKNLARYDRARPFLPWVYSIALNVCRDHLRKRKRGITELIESMPKELSSPAHDTRREVSVNDEMRVMEEGLRTLSTKERSAIVLRDIEGLSTAEVAEAMGTRETTVRSHISRARTKLKLYRDRIRREES